MQDKVEIASLTDLYPCISSREISERESPGTYSAAAIKVIMDSKYYPDSFTVKESSANYYEFVSEKGINGIINKYSLEGFEKVNNGEFRGLNLIANAKDLSAEDIYEKYSNENL